MKTRFKSAVQLALIQTAFVLLLATSQTVKAASWVTNGPMTTPRAQHTATLLPNSKVLITGGNTSSSEIYDSFSGTCVAAGSMNMVRAHHTATLLQNGIVLVAGGWSGSSQTSVELFDPAKGTWSQTTPLNMPRSDHTATLLSNGKLLVAGGMEGSNTVELYNPITGTWIFTGDLHTPRQGHTATLLPNGKVLVAGGYGAYNPLTGSAATNSAELFDPSTGVWTPTGVMTARRVHHTATLLPNGKVLVAGGSQVNISSGYLSSAELYDPTSGTWTPTDPMAITHVVHSATLLPNGQVLVHGGDYWSELFNPLTGKWTTIRTSSNPRSFHTATLLPNGKVLIAGGAGAFFSPLSSTEVFDSADGSWTNTGATTTARFFHTTTLLPDGKVLIAGGFNNNVFLSSAMLYEPSTGVWTNTGSLNSPRRNHTATLLPNGTVLVAGGQDSDEITVPPLTELYEPTGMWTTNSPMITPRFSHTATLLPNGKVLVAGGMDADENSLASAELYDLVAGTWNVTDSMAEARDRHTATLLPDGKVLVAGGYGDSGALSSAELYDPATGKWTPTNTLGTARAEHTATLLPGGKVLVAGGFGNDHTLTEAESYDPATGLWSPTANMASPRTAHTATLLLNGQVLVAGGLWNSNGAWVTIAGAELYDPAIKQWTPGGALTSERYYHEALLLRSGKLLVTGGVDGGSSTELFDVGLGCSNSWKPQIVAVKAPIDLGSSLVITGSQFRGISRASSGNTQNSSTDYPLVQLRSIESGHTIFLLTTNWSTNSFTSLPVWNFPPGWAMATVFVNGIPSTSSIVSITVPIPTPPTITALKKLTEGTFQFAFTNSVGAVFGALASTNVSLPLSNWTALSGVTEVSPGQFQFTDSQATNSPQRFYRVRAN